jgi:hypothetical protein
MSKPSDRFMSEPWSDEEVSRARDMKRNGRTFEQIGNAIGRSKSAVRHKIGSYFTDTKRWTKAQFDHLSSNAHKSDQELAEEVSQLGPERTPDAVKTKRRDLKFRRPDKNLEDDFPWPILRGTPEERDSTFVRLVWSEALRLRIFRRAA